MSYAPPFTTKHEDKMSNKSPMIDHRFIELDIPENNGKLSEDVMQVYIEHLKRLLSPYLLKPLMGLKGHAF